MGRGGVPRISWRFPKWNRRELFLKYLISTFFYRRICTALKFTLRSKKEKPPLRAASDLTVSYCSSTLLINSMNPHADKLINAEIVDSARSHVADVFGSDVVNSHGDQLVRIGMLVAQRLHLFDKLR